MPLRIKSLKDLQPGARARKGRITVAAKADRTMDGIVFDSKGEMLHYAGLTLRQRAGEISGLRRQPEFILHCPTPHDGLAEVGTYTADFVYVDHRLGRRVVEEYKGSKWAARQTDYRQRRRHAELEYGITVVEVVGS